MAPMACSHFWLLATGFGMLWHGCWIMISGRLPRRLRGAAGVAAKPGSQTAFMAFWLDQYSWIGVALSIGGLMLALAGIAL